MRKSRRPQGNSEAIFAEGNERALDAVRQDRRSAATKAGYTFSEYYDRPAERGDHVMVGPVKGLGWPGHVEDGYGEYLAVEHLAGPAKGQIEMVPRAECWPAKLEDK